MGKVLPIVLVIVFMVMFIMMVIGIATDSDEMIWKNSSILFAAMFVLVIVTIFVNMLGRSKAQNAEYVKKCASCGSSMDITEHACPRCRAIQPSAERREKRWDE
jgi:hypothetical protein